MWKKNLSIVMVFVLTLMVSLCPVFVPTKASAEINKKTLAVIDSISVSGEGEAAELIIKLSSPVTYTSYKTTAPLRLVVDISQATQGEISAPIVINKGNFKTVTVNRYDTDAGVLTRVDIELAKDAEAIITTASDNKNEIRISFPASPAQEAVSQTTAPAVKEAEPAKESVVTNPGGAVVSSPSPAPETKIEPPTLPVEQVAPVTPSAKNESATPAIDQARSLSTVTVKNDAIVLVIEGGVGDFKTFRLNKPERFVVDLIDTKSKLGNRIIPVNAAGVASARIGLYPDKVRVVLDAVNETFPEASATKTNEGITITLNSKKSDENPNTHITTTHANNAIEPSNQSEKKTDSLATADVPAAKHESLLSKNEVPRSSLAAVEMIDFQVVDGVSRVSVKISGDIAFDAPVKSPGFVTLTVKNASLPKHLQRSLETKGFISPVLRITPIKVKTRKGFDTKIRVALRTEVPFEFKHEGDMLIMDFKNPVGIPAEKTQNLPHETITQVARNAKTSASEAELSSELSPATESATKPFDSSKLYKGRKVTLEFADAEVRKIFQLLSEVSNKNFVLGDDVTGTISIKLVNVPWDQALDIILDTKGLDKRIDGNIIVIKGKGKFKSQAEEEQEIKKQQFKAIELKTETFSVNYSDIGSIVGQFSALKTDRGAIAQDARTNKVIVKDIPQAIDDMRKLLQQLDVPEKQVMIEARIVEATSTFTRSLGVNWGVHFRDGSGSFMGINSLDTGFGGLTSAAPTTGTGVNPGGSMGISFGTLTSNIQLDMRLNAAASAGLIKIVSTPKVATINNKTAKITQGQQIPYTSSTSDKVETKFIEAALSLEVTPHINANGTIGMKIDAKNDSPGTSSGGAAPPINKKQATTEMLLRDGETTVIGGIYVDSDTESDDGVPFLMDIPFLGTLFKTNSKSKTKTELLIFITPRILGFI
jgi:type IV pilus assembly protein PilQ